ncbi:MFS transporter [Enterococcus alcedinis]|uniref:MFS transporter n=1 Tax=Enterococcus alcedinis TaxID=1274384 RepID=A0A917JH61_9ENTE|nr:MFS transporter [Enterococcus alcedinis]MBP2101418.1 GPH family glycoside/pentoside/hexuronide:cation symporter [Enterococcus alcedinis]GGI65189.1 MFS transporter [Enterococcus alcedinis]
MENQMELQDTTKVGVLERIAYGFGDFGCNIIYTAMTTYLLFYYTDYAGVNAAAVGFIMLISRFLDGLTDVAMGMIVDRTKTKYGKARPWILRMAIPFGVAGVLLFSVPTQWESTWKLIYVFLTYNLVSSVLYTAINVPYSSLNALMTQDPYERSVLSIFRNLLATLGTLIINSYTLTLVNYFGDDASAWTKTFSIFGVFAVLAFMINFFGTKERVKPINEESTEISFKEGIQALFKNKYWMMVTGILMLLFINMALTTGSTVYYAKSILGNNQIAQMINSLMNIAQIVSMFLVAPFVKRLGKRNSMGIGLIIQSIGTVLIVVLGGSIFGIYASSIVRGIGGAFSGAVMWAMVSDTVDYGEWKTGLRMEGLTNSASSFGYKVGNGLGSALLGVILSLGGYAGQATVQSAQALISINFVFWVLPIAINMVILLVLFFYKLDGEFEGMVADLNQRKNQ